MGSSISFGRRRRGLPRPVVLVLLGALALTGWVVWDPGGGSEPPPLKRESAPGPAREKADAGREDSGGATPVDQEKGAGKASRQGGEHPPAGVGTPEQEEAPQKEARGDRLAAALQRLEAVRREGKRQALRTLLGKLVLDPALPRDHRRQWLQELDTLNEEVVFSPSQAPGFTILRVRPGETYTHVARRLKEEHGVTVTPGLLELINRTPPRRLRANQRLKAPLKELSVVVHKAGYQLFVLLGGIPVRHYEVGLGAEGSTPAGRFTLGGKAKNPTWTDPRTGEIHHYGEPGHLVGTRWIRFYEDGAPTAYGIHGTSEPETIGRSLSMGCIRLRNEDVEELYDLVPDGTQVLVVP